jgi:hypothetical protein
MYGPQSILPEPIEEFADEPADSPASPLRAVRADQIEVSAPHAAQIPSAEPPRLYRPRRRPQAVPEVLIRIFQGAAALVCVAAFIWLVAMPTAHETERSTSARSLSIPEERAAPAPPAALQPTPPARSKPAPATPQLPGPLTEAAASRPEPTQTAAVTPAVLSERAPASAPPDRAVDSKALRTLARPDPKKPETPKQTQLAKARPAVANPVVSANRASPEPATTTEADRRRPTPTLDVHRLETGTVSALGQPVAPPAAEVASPVALRERPPSPEPPARPAPTGTAGNSVADVRIIEREKVRSVLSRYERAYSQLDAAAAARLYPGVDRKALSRAFGSLSSQQIQFNDCRIQVTQSTAYASCAGKASWTPRVGGGPKEQARRWQFDLKQVAGDWQIGSVRVQ